MTPHSIIHSQMMTVKWLLAFGVISVALAAALYFANSESQHSDHRTTGAAVADVDPQAVWAQWLDEAVGGKRDTICTDLPVNDDLLAQVRPATSLTTLMCVTPS